MTYSAAVNNTVKQIVDNQSRGTVRDVSWPARTEDMITVNASIAKTAGGGWVVSATVLSVVISIVSFNEDNTSDFSAGPLCFAASTVFCQRFRCSADDRSRA